jgi:hypothetical protein
MNFWAQVYATGQFPKQVRGTWSHWSHSWRKDGNANGRQNWDDDEN